MSVRLPDLSSYERSGHLKPFAEFLGGRQPTASDVVHYAAHLRRLHDQRRYAPATVNVLIAAAKAWVRSADSSEVERLHREVTLMGANGLTVGRSQHETLTAAEIETLVESAPPVLALIIGALVQTGLRISELLQMQLADLELVDGCFRAAVTGKGGKPRIVMLSRDLVTGAREACQGERLLFEHSGRPYNRAAVTTRIRELSERELGKRITAHTLRHHCAR